MMLGTEQIFLAALLAAACFTCIYLARPKGNAVVEEPNPSAEHGHPPPAHFQNWKFCPLCSSSLEYRHICDRPRLACSDASCRFVHWDNPKPVAVVLVDMGEGIVLTRRRYAPQAGTWCLPGGFVEAHEDAALAAKREVLEETGLEVEITGLLGVYAPDSDANEVIVAYSARPVGGALGAGEEVLETGCFSRDELPASADSYIGFPKHREIIHNWFAAR